MISTPADLKGAAPAADRPEIGLSAGALAVVAAASLVYISGTFLLADALGIKRLLQGIFAVPMVIMASYSMATNPRRLVDPLVGYVLLKSVAEIALRGGEVELFDDLASLFALIVIAAASPGAARQGARAVSTLAGVLALMALAQWIALFLQPGLADELLSIDDEGHITGTVHHVIALLGLATGEHYTLFGHPVSRLQSFAKEPSLNLVYFLIPSAIGFLRGGRGIFWGITTLVFCVLSLSGSVLLSLAFAMAAWFALRLFTLRRVVLWGTMLIFAGYVAALGGGGASSMLDFLQFLSQYGDFMSKRMSFTSRAGGAASSLAGVPSAPFGSPKLPELPAPWMVNGVLYAGWLGALMLVLFVARLAKQLDIFRANHGQRLNVRVGSLILIGALGTVVIFNDYQMSNYPGLVLLAIAYRLIESQNEVDRGLRSAPAAPPESKHGPGAVEHAPKAV